MKSYHFALGAALAGAISCASYAQEAFGIERGAPISSLTIVKKPTADNPYYYVVSPPIKNAEADFTSVVATPETGVCKVSMVGKDYDNDSFGEKGRSAFQKFTEALTAKYGDAAKEFDFLMSSSIWDDADDYSMALRQGDRTKSSFWTPESDLPEGLSGISLELKAVSSTTTYLSITYEFSNFPRCQNLMKAKDTAGI